MKTTGDMEGNAPVVLTIAGFDPSGGAGIIADVKTILHFGCSPVAAITSLTFQNAEEVFGATHETGASVRAQILPIVKDCQIEAVKIGMLPTAEIVLEISRLILDKRLPLPVIDPVIRSSSGYELMESDAFELMRTELMPLARLITPNIPEAEVLTGVSIEDEAGMRAAAAKLREMAASAVLIKGGHLRGPEVGSQRSEVRSQRSAERQAIDVLDDAGEITVFRAEWIDAQPVRGTGCMLSSAIAANLALGNSLSESVRIAKQFVAGQIQNSRAHTQNRKLKTEN